MSWYTDLDSNIQAEIEKDTGCKIAIEAVFDPTDRNITLTGIHGVSEITDVIRDRFLEPGNDYTYYVRDVRISFYNPDHYFDAKSTDANFYGEFADIKSYLAEDAAAGASQIVLPPMLLNGFAKKFNNKMYVTLYSGGNQETVFIESCASYAGMQTYNISPALTYSHSAGTYVYTRPYIGKTLKIVLRFMNTTADPIVLYEGDITAPIEYENGLATFIIKDSRYNILNSPLYYKGSPLTTYTQYDRILDGKYLLTYSQTPQTYYGGNVTLDYNLVYSDVDFGNFDISQVTWYEGVPVGVWTIEFTSATEFLVYGYNTIAKSGNTSTDFFNETDASDSFIKIAAAAWAGISSPESGDYIEIYCGIIFVNKTAPQIIYELLYHWGGITNIDAAANFYGTDGLHVTRAQDEPSAPDADYSFDYAYIDRQYERMSICFYKPISILEAIQEVSKHGMLITYPDRDGLWKINSRYPRYFIDNVGSITESNCVDFKIESYEPANEITVNYAMQYRESYGGIDDTVYSISGITNKLLGFYTFPETDALNTTYQLYGYKRNINIDFPAYYNSTVAKIQAQRYCALMKDGIKYYDIIINLEGISLEIGDRVAIVLSDQKINTVAEIFYIGFSKRKGFLVNIKAFDLYYNPEEYAVTADIAGIPPGDPDSDYDQSYIRTYTDYGFMAW